MDAENLKPRWQFVAWPKRGEPGVPQWADFTDEHDLNDLVYEKAREAQGNAHNIVEYQWGSVVYEIDIVNMTQNKHQEWLRAPNSPRVRAREPASRQAGRIHARHSLQRAGSASRDTPCIRTSSGRPTDATRSGER